MEGKKDVSFVFQAPDFVADASSRAKARDPSGTEGYFSILLLNRLLRSKNT